MLTMDKMKLVELYGGYKRDRIAPSNVDIYDHVVKTLCKEMPRIIDPKDAIDFIDHIADQLRWSCVDRGDVKYELKKFLEFYA